MMTTGGESIGEGDARKPMREWSYGTTVAVYYYVRDTDGVLCAGVVGDDHRLSAIRQPDGTINLNELRELLQMNSAGPVASQKYREKAFDLMVPTDEVVSKVVNISPGSVAAVLGDSDIQIRLQNLANNPTMGPLAMCQQALSAAHAACVIPSRYGRGFKGPDDFQYVVLVEQHGVTVVEMPYDKPPGHPVATTFIHRDVKRAHIFGIGSYAGGFDWERGLADQNLVTSDLLVSKLLQGVIKEISLAETPHNLTSPFSNGYIVSGAGVANVPIVSNR